MEVRAERGKQQRRAVPAQHGAARLPDQRYAGSVVPALQPRGGAGVLHEGVRAAERVAELETENAALRQRMQQIAALARV